MLNQTSYTVNSKYYSIITFVFSSLWSGTRDVQTSSSLCSSAASHPSSHTVNGKYCCNLLSALYSRLWVFQYRKRQALLQHKGEVDKIVYEIVSIPQAVGTVATKTKHPLMYPSLRFNTASGRHCCNSGVQKASIHAVPKASFGKPQTVNGKFSPHQVLEGLETLVNTGGKPFF